MPLRLFEHVQLVAHGAFAAGGQWSIGFQFSDSLAPSTAWSNADVQSLATGLDAAMKTFINTSGVGNVLLGSGGSYQGVNAYAYHANAHTAYFAAQANTGGVQPVGSISLPLQTCLVISLLSNFPGRAFRGRVYLPKLMALNSPPREGSTQVVGIPPLFATMLQSINHSVSRGLVSVGTAGAAVINVRMDDLPDTQRRRRDKIQPLQIKTSLVPL